MANVSKKKVTSNLIWRLLERVGAQGVSFIVSIVLARILDPSVYGTIALVTVFTTILQVFVDSGLANALIQKKDADDVDFSTVFYFNIVFCFILYFAMFFAAPYIAKFYNVPTLTPVIRVLSLTVVISGVKNVQQAYVSRTLQFKRFFWATLGGTIGAAVIGIVMAVCGYGVWALVAQSLFNLTVDTLILWITVKWRPKLVFSFHRLKGLFSFGWKLLVAKLADTVYIELRSLIIGKKYSTEDLAFYNKGQQFPKLIVTNIDISVESVLFPVMSSEQDNLSQVKAMLKKVVQVNSYIMSPLMMGLAVCGEPLIKLLLTEKWLPCVPYLQVFCFIYAFTVFNTANMNTYRSLGRSDIYLKVELVRKIVGIVDILVTMKISVFAMAIGEIIATLVSLVINTYPNKKLLDYGLLKQIRDMLPNIIITLVMGAVVYSLTFLHINEVITLVLQIIVGVVCYLVLSLAIKSPAFGYILSIVKKDKK